eukprot:TRINITY_DN18569_c0_g1_i2.p1 TRINITY_DN18569_c0_g1~~TRINITY_DN18569_c0_g1_i2.p1  ORF type:complete len:440 (+),score=88.10 TRINITY_DN18569_c0_g1_i2:149-1468(+)
MNAAAGGDAAAAEVAGFPPRNLFGAADSEALLSTPGLPQLQRQSSKKRLVAGVDQSELVDPWVIADSDSRFAEFRDLRIHYKRADPFPLDEENAAGESSFTGQRVEIPAVLLHGFGASVFSWERVLSPLANILGASTIAFDRPAFGLTTRVKPSQMKSSNGSVVNPYSFGFSAAASIAFVDMMKARKAIMIAHSAGAIVAANAFLHAPDRIAALILIGPALAAPILRMNSREREKEKEKPAEERVERRGFLASIFFTVIATLTWLFMYVGAAFQKLKQAAEALQQRIFAVLLRSPVFLWLIRTIMDKYGQWAVRFAWYDKEGPGKHVLDGYTKPLRCKDWDKALAEFVLAVAASDSKQPPLAQRLDEITCPVLVVTGDTDRLVPAWNAKRLAKQLPNAKFHMIPNCGHLPQEERPEELLKVIEDFIRDELMRDGRINGA